MNRKLVFCFSGQGSQYYQMGKELYQTNDVFRLWLDRQDEIVRDLIDVSVISIMYNEKNKISDQFNRTIYTHPAIIMMGYALYRVLAEKGIIPDFLLGASLGEYITTAISGVMTYEEVLVVAVEQAQLIEKMCQEGGMTAILKDLSYFDQIKMKYPDVELASINSSHHFVISGLTNSLLEIEQSLKAENIIFQRLPVSYAFHSELIDPAREAYLRVIEKIQYKQPSVPVLSCALGTEVKEPTFFHSPYLWNVTRQPIFLKKTIKSVEENNRCLYVDVGPAGTLSNMIKMNLNGDGRSKALPVLSPFNRTESFVEKAIKEIIAGKQ